jgi:hypothetical protein
VTDKDALLREAEELRRSAESIKHLDETVEMRSNAGKRQNLVDAIKKVQRKYLDTPDAWVASKAGTIHSELIKSVNGMLRTDLTSITSLRDHYEGTPNWDTVNERRLLVSECFTRIDLLNRRILEGKLDHLLGYQAEILVHGVMGYNGEILEALGIDPRQGETYMRITEPRQELLSAEVDEAHRRQRKKLVLDTDAIIVKVFARAPKPQTSTSSDIAEGCISTPRKIGKTKSRGKIIKIMEPNIPEKKISTLQHGGLGITGYTLIDAIASKMGLEKELRGILVIEVFKNSIAEQAGLRAGTIPATFGGRRGMLGGDIITAIEDQPITSMEELISYLNHYHIPGTKIKLRVIRDRKRIIVTLDY